MRCGPAVHAAAVFCLTDLLAASEPPPARCAPKTSAEPWATGAEPKDAEGVRAKLQRQILTAVYTAIGDRDGQVETLNSMGDLAVDHPPAGDPEALFTQARTLARTMDAALYEARALAGLGRSAQRTHDVPTATTSFTQALTIYQRLGSPEAATITNYLAELHHDTGQHPEAV